MGPQSAPDAGDDLTVDIVLEYGDDDHVDGIQEGMTKRVPPPRIRDLSEAAQLVIAGSISLRILIDGLRSWADRSRRKVMCHVSDGKLHVRTLPEDVGEVVVYGQDGQETRHAAGEPDALLEAALKKALGA